jgi:MATE family multidrug resistance protein
LQAAGVTRPLVVAAIVANVLNLPLSWLLVFGDAGLVELGLPALGVPSFGVVGAGVTSTLVMGLQLAVIASALGRVPCDEAFGRRPRRALMLKALAVGLPIGLQRLAEIGIFSITGVLMAKISTRAVAAHQVALILATASFMVPLGISSAATARVGHAVGKGDRLGARRAGFASFVLAITFMSLCASAMIAFPTTLARLLTDQEAVIEAARPLIIIAAFFQISDGLQIVVNGALRGMGDTRVVLYLNLVAHYALGVPLGVGLAFGADWGARGLWWGLFAGLSAVALALLARFVRLSARDVARL